jgi:ABC-2 type transport system permease protein
MNARRIYAVMDKEWTLTFHNWLVWVAILLPPAALAALLLCVCHQIHFVLDYVSQLLTQNKITQLKTDEWSAWLMDYFLMFFVALPAANATRFAAGGIIADKASRSLEPQLATPLTTGEFIFGKVLAAVVPPVFAAMAACGIFLHVTRSWGITQCHLLGNTGNWSCRAAIFTLTLLLTNLLALSGFIIASRKTEARGTSLTATSFAQFARFFPPACIYWGYKRQIAGATWALEIIGLLLLANAVLFLFSQALFQRETILFKWK